jgi:hypothetical protein
MIILVFMVYLPEVLGNLYVDQWTSMQAFERQADMLSRQISRGNMDAEGLDKERLKLLERLHSAEHVGPC